MGVFPHKLSRRRVAASAVGLVVLAGAAAGITAATSAPARAVTTAKKTSARLSTAEFLHRWDRLVDGPTVESAGGGGATITAWVGSGGWWWRITAEPTNLADLVGSTVTVAPAGTTVVAPAGVQIPGAGGNVASYGPGDFAVLSGLPLLPAMAAVDQPVDSLARPTVVSSTRTSWQVRFATPTPVCGSTAAATAACHFGGGVYGPTPTTVPSGKAAGPTGTGVATVKPAPGGGLQLTLPDATMAFTPTCLGAGRPGCYPSWPPAGLAPKP